MEGTHADDDVRRDTARGERRPPDHLGDRDSDIGDVITKAVIGSGLSVLLLAPVAATLPPTDVALMVLAVGSGSLFLSHVDDAGSWLVKQYLGTSVSQTFKTWSGMECLLSVTGLLGVLLISVIV